MTVIVEGSKMPDFEYQTAFEQNLRISDTVQRVSGKTAVVFLRYYGCTMCQYNLHQYLLSYDNVKAADGQLLIVFQSDPALVREQLEESPLPFDIICDPSQSLYKKFEIGSVAEKADLFDEEGKKFIAAIKASGEFPHGKYEGDELQLPASFVVDRDLNVVYSRYGKRANDVISPDDLANVLAQ